jgi:hypothetical protein
MESPPVQRLDTEEPGEKVLIFTQYRATQDCLCIRLAELFPGSRVEVIHGDAPPEERRRPGESAISLRTGDDESVIGRPAELVTSENDIVDYIARRSACFVLLDWPKVLAFNSLPVGGNVNWSN